MQAMKALDVDFKRILERVKERVDRSAVMHTNIAIERGHKQTMSLQGRFVNTWYLEARLSISDYMPPLCLVFFSGERMKLRAHEEAFIFESVSKNLKQFIANQRAYDRERELWRERGGEADARAYFAGFDDRA